MSKKHPIGTVGWVDLTVENAEEVRDFYSEVISLKSENHNMGEYNDYSMISPDTGEAVSGICHSLGSNKDIPPQWMIYVYVADIEKSAEKVIKNGGKIIKGPTAPSQWGRHLVIQDPAGAHMVLAEEPEED